MFRSVFAVLAAALLVAPALAQDVFPSRPLTIVVPFPPGNSSDISMRLIGKHLATRLKQAVVVENRAGAGGSIGAAYAARRPANGYTIVMGSTGPMAISPAMRKTLPYDPVKDFDPLAAIAYIPQLFVSRPDGPIKDIPALVRLAKEKPDGIRYGSSGIGSTQHLLMAEFANQAGVTLTHVPYQGSQQALGDIVGGQIDLLSDAVSSLIPMVKAGRVRPLAVTTAKRLAVLPDVPTVAEGGPSAYNMQSWILVFTPAGTPEPILKRLNDEIEAILKEPEVATSFADQGFYPMAVPFAQLRPFVANEVKVWRQIVAISGATAE